MKVKGDEGAIAQPSECGEDTPVLAMRFLRANGARQDPPRP